MPVPTNEACAGLSQASEIPGGGNGAYPDDELVVDEPQLQYPRGDFGYVRIAMRKLISEGERLHVVPAFGFRLEAGDPVQECVESGLLSAGARMRHRVVPGSLPPPRGRRMLRRFYRFGAEVPESFRNAGLECDACRLCTGLSGSGVLMTCRPAFVAWEGSPVARRAVRLQTGGPFLEVLLVESPPSVRDADLRQRVSVETDQAREEESRGE